MKKLLLVIFGLLFSLSYGQKHELGIFLGGANVIGDIGRDNYINPLPQTHGTRKASTRIPIAIGALYRLNINPYMGFRLSATFAQAVGIDANAPEDYKKKRDYQFKNNIAEGALLFEYNFFDINDEYGRKYSPYIFGGVAAYMYDNLKYNVDHSFLRDENGVITDPPQMVTEIATKKQKKTGFTMPFGAGFKFRYRRNFMVSAEVGFRYTKTDNLDFSFADPKDFTFTAEPGLDPDLIEHLNDNIIRSRQVGNMSNYDWYVFTGITVTYSFGRPPCYCN